VLQKDVTEAIGIHRTYADDIAGTLPDPTTHGNTTAGFSGVVEDDDAELQAALHASFVARSDQGSSSQNLPGSSAQIPDPVLASQERNRSMLDRMRQEQEQAQRELWESGYHRPDTPEDEDEILKRAIAESEAFARASSSSEPSGAQDDPSGLTAPEFSRRDHHRVYDDEDADLQAALRASLEDGPVDVPMTTPISLPTPTKKPIPGELETTSGLQLPSSTIPEDAPSPSEESVTEQEASSEPVDFEEMRRRRLARFGG
jgi:Ataxin-3